jgi:integrating conjugative element protein (TIGR03749 family)
VTSRAGQLLALLLPALASLAHATEILRWERVPLPISLQVSQERILFIDRAVRVAVPTSINERLRVQTLDGAVYLRASLPFDATRLQLQDEQTGTMILLDVSARQATDDAVKLEPIRIVVPSSGDSKSGTGASGRDDSSTVGLSDRATHPTPHAAVLIRYAAQSLYAPLRTIEPVSGIAQTPVLRTLPFDTLLPTVPVGVRPLGAWRLQEDWVTALQLTNKSVEWIRLDPRAIQGDFVAACFQHLSVGPSGDSTDTTVLYLVTHGHGLAESLVPAISPIDASKNLPHPPDTGNSGEK